MCSMPRKEYQCLAPHFKLFSGNQLFFNHCIFSLYFITHCPFSIPMQRVWSTYLDSSRHRQERSSDPNLVRPNTHHDNFSFYPSSTTLLTRWRIILRMSLLLVIPTSTHSFSSRSSSRLSIAASAYSAAGSTRHILGGHNNGDYDPPSSPPGMNDSRDTLSYYRGPIGTTATGVSLMVNYLPSKFSASLVSRKGDKGIEPHLPKSGGGVEAFRSGESRMGDRRLRWNKFKWILFCTNFCVRLSSIAILLH